MIIICMWCKKKLGEKPPYEDKRISHGLCKECYEEHKLKEKKTKEKE